MHAYPRWKIWLILITLVLSVMASLPNVTSVPSWWPSSLSKPMNLGLDLKGGIHLVVDVDVDVAVAHNVEEEVSTVRSILRQHKIRYKKLDAKGHSILLTLKNSSDMKKHWHY